MILSRWAESDGAQEVHTIPGATTALVPAPNKWLPGKGIVHESLHPLLHC